MHTHSLLRRINIAAFFASLITIAPTSQAQFYDPGYEQLYNFADADLVNPDFTANTGGRPHGLILASDGAFYGTTETGGSNFGGTVYKITKAGAVTRLVNFGGTDIKGINPTSRLVESNNGFFYGTTQGGGAWGQGTIFKMTPAGILTTLVEFTGDGLSNKGSSPKDMTLGSDGNLYGTTAGGASGFGTVFRLTPNGALTTLVNFTGNGAMNKGSGPVAALIQASDGNFYGSTIAGGASDLGTIFKMTPAGALTTLFQFSLSDPNYSGSYPAAPLTEGNDGNFYGGTLSGDIFKMTPQGAMTTFATFGEANGQFPYGELLLLNDGNFYGTTSLADNIRDPSNGFRSGSIFRVSPDGTLTTLADFYSENPFSSTPGPRGGLVADVEGNLYGTHYEGGSFSQGFVFKFAPGGTLTTLAEFNSKKAVNPVRPRGGLLQAADGDFYGTCTDGGLFGNGAVYKITADGKFTTLANFNKHGGFSTRPLTELVQDNGGNFYGITETANSQTTGTAFRMTPDGSLSTINEFNELSPTQSKSPRGLILADDGDLYGAARNGGLHGKGTIFRLNLDADGEQVETTLVDFDDTTKKGNFPNATLLQAGDGSFYGTTQSGGEFDFGTVFRVTGNGELTTLVEFTGNGTNNKGRHPQAALIIGGDGNFYGSTTLGGTLDHGTIFKMTPDGTLTTVVDFANNGAINSGRNPEAALLLADDGNYYGTCSSGGNFGGGTIFRMAPGGTLTTLVAFSPLEANNPISPLIQGTDGNLYGTAFSSGINGSGTAGGVIFRLIFPGSPLLFSSDTTLQSRTGAVVQTMANARGSATVVSLEYGTDGVNFPLSLPVTGNLTGFQSKLVGTPLSGLVEGTTYFYRFRAVSGAGTTLSEVRSFSTLAQPVVDAIPASDITPTSARLNGTVNARNLDSSVFIEWGTSAFSFPNKIDTSPAMVTGDTALAVSAILPGLQMGGTYFYRVVATSAGGTTTSGTQSFRTLIPATTTITGAAALSTTRAQVTGFVDPKGSSAEVSFEYGTDGINFPNSFSASPLSVSGVIETQVTATLTGLTQGTTYHVRIRAQGPGGTGLSASSTFSLSILSGLVQIFPDPPPASDRSVTVNFTPPSIGAWRFAGDTEWRNSGVPAGNLASGQRVIEFLPLPGFIRPPSETVDVTGGADITLERGYFDTPSAGSGSLTVQLKPDEIAAPGVPLAQRAQWRIVGEAAWRNSGDTPSGLVAGSYLVECKPVTGRETPPTIAVSIADADAQDLTLTYFTANSAGGLAPLPQTYADVSANEDMPFAYVGQIRSEVGSSTGFVVKRRVVSTAGHVVFDDGTLSSITDLRWFFQRHKDTHEPRPQIPRGYYLAAGYAGQRFLDQSPGEGSAQSQNLDYASLYFTEEAGRGGYGGYLASDSGDDNEFLNSAAEKILAGFPTSGIPSADSGKLHATTAFTSALTPAFGESWTTTAVRGLGGMSGGPLFVRFENGSYFPAAIYLGGAGQTVVRAIDSDVVELFLRAEVSANGGDNNTDGGVTHTSVTGNLNTSQAGSLRVIIEPAGAVTAGASWKLNPESTLRSGGSQKSGLSPGTYNLGFASVAGFLAPTIQAVTVTGGQLTTITYTYQETGGTSPLDTWRQTNFGTTSNTGDAADGHDFDKDGETNIEEFTAGTNPKSGSAVLQITTTTKSDNTYTATVAGKAGRTYKLQRNTTLTGTWTTVATRTTLTSDEAITLADPAAPAGSAYYRIEVAMP